MFYNRSVIKLKANFNLIYLILINIQLLRELFYFGTVYVHIFRQTIKKSSHLTVTAS
jgi:hypothetical protein